MSLISITHDMGVVADVADEISVMYAGRVVEDAPVGDIYARPAHPYTKALLESIPRVDMKGQELAVIGLLGPDEHPAGLLPTRGAVRPGQLQGPPEPPHYDVDVDRIAACHYWRWSSSHDRDFW